MRTFEKPGSQHVDQGTHARRRSLRSVAAGGHGGHRQPSRWWRPRRAHGPPRRLDSTRVRANRSRTAGIVNSSAHVSSTALKRGLGLVHGCSGGSCSGESMCCHRCTSCERAASNASFSTSSLSNVRTSCTHRRRSGACVDEPALGVPQCACSHALTADSLHHSLTHPFRELVRARGAPPLSAEATRGGRVWGMMGGEGPTATRAPP